MDLWGSSSKLDEESGRWNSVSDALQAISSLSRVKKVSDSNFSTSDKSEKSSGAVSFKDPIYQVTSGCSTEATIDEASSLGLGRGKLLKELEKQFSTRQQLDDEIYTGLRMIGPGFSNELIEHCFGTTYPPSNGFDSQETGIFSDCDIEENETVVDFVIGESDIMKKVSEAEKSLKKKLIRRPLKCRNAIILNLLKKKEAKENEQDEKKESVLLKGPDVFLSNKSYKTAISASHSSEHTDVPLFTDKDFPAL